MRYPESENYFHQKLTGREFLFDSRPAFENFCWVVYEVNCTSHPQTLCRSRPQQQAQLTQQQKQKQDLFIWSAFASDYRNSLILCQASSPSRWRAR
ncbi:MAG TPA: hypothetical protein DC047_19880 [Blastocatellia bacterium]|nr:hypothetical protein [Blastocatellia bacterium]